jgi:hypothetical protein
MHPPATAASALILLLVIATLCYGGLCYARPFGPCRKCRDTGRPATGRRARQGRRYCRRCGNTRLRLRIGRRAWNLLHDLYKEGTR